MKNLLLILVLGFATLIQSQPNQKRNKQFRNSSEHEYCNKKSNKRHHRTDKKFRKFKHSEKCNMLGIKFKNLTDKEKSKFKEIKKEFKTSIKSLHNELQLKNSELKYLVKKNNPSITEINSKIELIGAIKLKLQLKKLEMREKILTQIPVVKSKNQIKFRSKKLEKLKKINAIKKTNRIKKQSLNNSISDLRYNIMLIRLTIAPNKTQLVKLMGEISKLKIKLQKIKFKQRVDIQSIS